MKSIKLGIVILTLASALNAHAAWTGNYKISVVDSVTGSSDFASFITLNGYAN